MEELFTRDGRPLKVDGNDVFDRSGRQVARLRGRTLHGCDGRYVGTLIGDRVVYRASDDTTISSPFSPRNVAGSAKADRPPVALRGDEPFVPDFQPTTIHDSEPAPTRSGRRGFKDRLAQFDPMSDAEIDNDSDEEVDADAFEDAFAEIVADLRRPDPNGRFRRTGRTGHPSEQPPGFPA
ncbi:MAG: hypothetical protein JWM76_4156 [Pseudonocardiales bacterium]|nr:hypothetical protein [Pseudonocardiales bacterium]